MRTIVMLIFLFIAGPCYADDPLEGLNTVEDTLSTMERTLDAQAVEQDDSDRESDSGGGSSGDLAGSGSRTEDN